MSEYGKLEEEAGENEESRNTESPRTVSEHEKKLPYPKSVFFIVSNEFCERFNYYGMRAILSLYLVEKLMFTEEKAKIVFHGFTVLAYFVPLIGAMLADSALGKFRTIFYLSCLYASGSIVLAIAAVPSLHLPVLQGTILGLVFIGVGTGGIKPCVAPFGGDQFVLPQQNHYLDSYFSFFYFAINAGSLISTFLTPILREKVHCFGDDSCYSLAFAVPGILMVVSVVVFLAGRPLYKIVIPKENVILNVCKCISHAVATKFHSTEKRDHWLDYSREKYGTLVQDLKILFRVLVLYIPVPLFWALYDQQGSAWTFQATRMDGNIGFYTILPDQMQVINPLLILAFIPLFEYVVYPLLAKCNILTKPLERLFAGGVLCALAFVISGFISLNIQKTEPILPSEGQAQLRIYNGLDCNISIPEMHGFPDNISIPSYGYYKNIHLKVQGNESFGYSHFWCNGTRYDNGGTFNVYDNEATAYFFYNPIEKPLQMVDEVKRSKKGFPNIRTLADPNQKSEIRYINSKHEVVLKLNASNCSLVTILPDKYTLQFDNFTTEVEFSLGGVYAVLVDIPKKTANVVVITNPSDVHMLWLLPQYIVMTVAEILFSITGLEFSYSQAPVSMKSVLQACWLLAVSMGDLVIVVVSAINYFKEQSSTYFFFTGLMLLDMLLFLLIASRYEYVTPRDYDEEDDNNESGDQQQQIAED